MSLNDPLKKMSKSESEDSYISLDESPEKIIKKFKRAVTDSDNQIRFGKDKPAISNLLVILSEFTNKSIEDLVNEYEGKGYGQFKTDIGEIVAENLRSLQNRYQEIRADEERLTNVITEGNRNAEILANEKVGIVKDKLGLI